MKEYLISFQENDIKQLLSDILKNTGQRWESFFPPKSALLTLISSTSTVQPEFGIEI